MTSDVKAQLSHALELHQLGNLPEAEKLYFEILKETPNEGNTLNFLGFLKFQNNQFTEAISYLKKATELYPNFFEAWFNLALALKGMGDFDNAIFAYTKSIEIEPENPTPYFNLATLYESLNETHKAIEYFEHAYKLNKDETDTDIPYFLSICYIKAKDFAKGLPLHEYRSSKKFAIHCQEVTYPEQFANKPLWDGTPMPGKTILVYYESALGDTLMYVRYLECLRGMFKKVLFKPQICFESFFKENNFGAEIIESRTLPHDLIFDVHIPLMSIPYVLGQFSENIPLSEGYLKANPEKVQEFKEKYFNNNKLKIGFKWMGNTVYDMTRVIDIESFYKLFELPNTQFYSLQKGDGVEEFEKIPKKYNVIDLSETFNDFSDTAAAVENLDLVICNDTSVAHLAAAMGKPTWILLPFVQNWRWHTDLSYSPWYKSAKLFKQSESDNWEEVFGQVFEELKKF